MERLPSPRAPEKCTPLRHSVESPAVIMSGPAPTDASSLNPPAPVSSITVRGLARSGRHYLNPKLLFFKGTPSVKPQLLKKNLFYFVFVYSCVFIFHVGLFMLLHARHFPMSVNLFGLWVDERC